jgi:hypothetical protein
MQKEGGKGGCGGEILITNLEDITLNPLQFQINFSGKIYLQKGKLLTFIIGNGGTNDSVDSNGKHTIIIADNNEILRAKGGMSGNSYIKDGSTIGGEAGYNGETSTDISNILGINTISPTETTTYPPTTYTDTTTYSPTTFPNVTYPPTTYPETTTYPPTTYTDTTTYSPTTFPNVTYPPTTYPETTTYPPTTYTDTTTYSPTTFPINVTYLPTTYPETTTYSPQGVTTYSP